MSVEYESPKVIDRLIKSAEATTGESYSTLTEAHQALKNGYGQGGNFIPEKPYLNTTLMTSLVRYCKNGVNIDTLPFIDSSNVVDYDEAFMNCSFKTQPDLNYRKGIRFVSAFEGSSVETLDIEIDDPVYFNYICRNCTKLKTVNLTVQNAITLAASFSGCTGLTEVNLNGTPNVTTFNQTFLNCKALKTIMGLDMSVMTTNVSTFQGCSALENISVNHINIVNNNFSLADSKLLTVDSLVGILNALSDNTSLSTTYTVQLGSENLAKLSIEQKLIAENKNIELI